MLKVLHHIPGFLFGGIESMYLGWYDNIDKDDVQFDLLLRTQDDEAPALLEYIKRGGIYYRLPSIKKFFSYVKETKRFFQQHHDYDILHSHGTDFFVCFFAKKYGINTIVVHSHSASCAEDLKEKIKHRLEKVSIALFGDYAFACSRLAAEFRYGGMTFHGRPVEIIHNAIDTAKYRYDHNIREEYRIDLGLRDKIVIGHVGRMTPQKNQFFLLDIFKSFSAQNPHSVLLMVGDGPDEKALKQYANELGISEQVIFTGARNDVPELLQAMDLFLLPSRWEGMPVTLVEAQVAGLPCVISDVISDEADVTDLVIRKSLQDTPDLWADAMESGFNQNLRRDRCKEMADGGYDIETETNKLINKYKQILKK